jgi:hypothetical protein
MLRLTTAVKLKDGMMDGNDSWREKKTSGGLDRVFIRKCNHIHSVATLPLPCTTTTVSNKTVAMFV